ncbi:hypothetical protein KUCAC02_018777 [Chaenocephalus aceratus]|uniref:Uncharacterized protein n=1 Tax=Chaenocephalus aceratus TaxID=36190 RepID=A0ACB9W9K8_CHAAC|nr:hypothetical protein KUCAC02_018777 [Chaenocephalus aceratus]
MSSLSPRAGDPTTKDRRRFRPVGGGDKRVCSGLLDISNTELITAKVPFQSKFDHPSQAPRLIWKVGHHLLRLLPPSPVSLPRTLPPHCLHSDPRQVEHVLPLSTKKASDFTVSHILTMDSEDSIINSLSSIDPVQIPEGYIRPPASVAHVWKVFSPQPLTPEQLQDMFITWDSSSETRWLAYPIYRPPQRKTPPFILHNRLYYLNAVEWAASAMEMSAISARNVALLAHHRGHQQEVKVDQEDLHTRLRGEL